MKKPSHKANKSDSKKKLKVVPKKAVNKIVPRKSAKVKTKIKAKTALVIKTGVRTKTKTKGMVVVKPKAIVSQPKILEPKQRVLEEKLPIAPTQTRGPTIFGPVNVKPYQAKKDEEYMSQEQLEHFRKVLSRWKSQLMTEVDRTMHHMQDEVSNYPDPVDRASQEEEFSLELRARDRERKLLRKIEGTLSRINDNDYGYCDDCGAEIGVRRLEARPTATQCIECKTISEIREKQIGEGG